MSRLVKKQGVEVEVAKSVPQLQKVIAFRAIALERSTRIPSIDKAVNRALQQLALYRRRRPLARVATEKEQRRVEALVRRGWELIRVKQTTDGTVEADISQATIDPSKLEDANAAFGAGL